MKAESLHALLIDRDLGELSSETAELLEAWLAEHPESAAAARSIRRTLETASAAVRRFPELARVESNVIAFPGSRWPLAPLALAASFLVMVGAAAWLGFRAGQEAAQQAAAGTRSVAAAPAQAAKRAGPWARYALASSPRGGLTIVRCDPQPQP